MEIGISNFNQYLQLIKIASFIHSNSFGFAKVFRITRARVELCSVLSFGVANEEQDNLFYIPLLPDDIRPCVQKQNGSLKPIPFAFKYMIM
jgi:hypothetical protein